MISLGRSGSKEGTFAHHLDFDRTKCLSMCSPGTSSLYGLFSENGPILMKPGTETLEANEYAWSNLVDYIWIDQPV